MSRWKDYLYFTHTERQGVLLLAVLIVCVCLLPRFLSSDGEEGFSCEEDSAFRKERDIFFSSLQDKKTQKNAHHTKNFRKEKNTAAPFSYPPEEVRFSSFDPNTADSIALLRLGLSSWTTRNIMNYRRKGGKFRHPKDLEKIYGMTQQQYAALLPYISIPTAPDTLSLLAMEQATPKDTVYKYPTGTTIDLNRADTTELKKIPGIGSAIARKIVNYRQRLGYYYRIEQLEEIHLRVEKLRPWFTLNKNENNRINLNRASLERIMHHPYFNYYQARVIVDYRKKKGKLTDVNQLSLYEEFTSADLERQAPYVCF